jgi:uncharacterized protein (TIGR02300 family)
MATTDYGTKFQCFQCGTKFYDLHRPEPICPKCGANQKDAPVEPEPGKGARETRRPLEEYEDVDVADLEVGFEEEEIAPFDDDAVLEGEEEGETEEY